jgi:hypothetical protein
MSDKNAVIDEAAILLFDPNLVWSKDLDDIKDSLAALLVSCRGFDNSVIQLLAYNLAEKIIGQDKTQVFSKIETRA